MLFAGVSGAQNLPLSQDGKSLLGNPMEQFKDGENLKNEDVSGDEMSMKEVFGDDQVFPFVAGLDSY